MSLIHLTGLDAGLDTFGVGLENHMATKQLTTVVVLMLAVLIVKELRRSNAIAEQDEMIQLEKFQRLRTLRMQYLEPLFAFVVVGSLVAADIAKSAWHVVAMIAGALLGLWFGAYRAKTTYIAAYPRYEAVVLRTNKESIISVLILIAMKILAEQDILPDSGIFPTIVAFLLGFLFVESFARVFMVKRYYDDELDSQEQRQPGRSV
jgi:positive regulator of sigma E activity